MVRLFVCIDILGVADNIPDTRRHHQTPEKRPTPDSTTAPETQHHTAHQKSHRDHQRHTARPETTTAREDHQRADTMPTA